MVCAKGMMIPRALRPAPQPPRFRAYLLASMLRAQRLAGRSWQVQRLAEQSPAPGLSGRLEPGSWILEPGAWILEPEQRIAQALRR